jgi:hypothetical protein
MQQSSRAHGLSHRSSSSSPRLEGPKAVASATLGRRQSARHRAGPPQHPRGESAPSRAERAALSKRVGLWSGGWPHGRRRANALLVLTMLPSGERGGRHCASAGGAAVVGGAVGGGARKKRLLCASGDHARAEEEAKAGAETQAAQAAAGEEEALPPRAAPPASPAGLAQLAAAADALAPAAAATAARSAAACVAYSVPTPDTNTTRHSAAAATSRPPQPPRSPLHSPSPSSSPWPRLARFGRGVRSLGSTRQSAAASAGTQCAASCSLSA